MLLTIGISRTLNHTTIATLASQSMTRSLTFSLVLRALWQILFLVSNLKTSKSWRSRNKTSNNKKLWDDAAELNLSFMIRFIWTTVKAFDTSTQRRKSAQPYGRVFLCRNGVDTTCFRMQMNYPHRPPLYFYGLSYEWLSISVLKWSTRRWNGCSFPLKERSPASWKTSAN